MVAAASSGSRILIHSQPAAAKASTSRTLLGSSQVRRSGRVSGAILVTISVILGVANVSLPLYSRMCSKAWLVPQKTEGSLIDHTTWYVGSTWDALRQSYLSQTSSPQKSARSHVALYAAKATIVNSSINETGEGKSFLAFDVGGAIINSTWARTRDRDAVTSYLKVSSSGGAAARYSRYTSFGNGWDIVHNRFEAWTKDQPTATLIYTVESPAALPTNNRATPKSQVSHIFDRDPALKSAGLKAKDFVKLVTDHISDKNIQHWEDFIENWEHYS
eukprot:TRINITY_DN16217_c0_g4_i1.p1 TRINITY_DN16217_c0_g4~~TRINITY_DN16217_c0_g4_i1.p1  ORF type:complete len:275 (-),score=16.30 TRINITY_DN16217_c0_g4_i1:177-1001(-)